MEQWCAKLPVFDFIKISLRKISFFTRIWVLYSTPGGKFRKVRGRTVTIPLFFDLFAVVSELFRQSGKACLFVRSDGIFVCYQLPVL